MREDTSPRNGTLQRKHRKIIARGEPPCSICGKPINYTLQWPDLWCYVLDHVVPITRGGSDAIENKAAAHRTCNRSKGDRLDGGKIIRKSSALNRTYT